MKKSYKFWMTQIVLTVATSIVCNAGVFAGNTAVINQSGGGSASIKQSGHSNSAKIVQGKRAALSKKIREQMRRGNRAVIQQEGDHNVASQTQTGEDNIGLVSQKGDRNTVTQQQEGKNNLAAAVQDGDDNTVTHSQTGAGNMHTVIEVGDGKSVTVSQSGNNE